MRAGHLLAVLALLACLPSAAQNFQRYNGGVRDIALYNPAAAVNAGYRDAFFSRFNICSSDESIERVFHFCDLSVEKVRHGVVVASVASSGYTWFGDRRLTAGYATGWGDKRSSFNIGATASLDFNRVRENRKLYVLPDVTFGFEYCLGTFRVGASVVNAVSPAYLDFFRNPRAFVSHISATWDKSSLTTVTPFAVCTYVGDVFSADLGLTATWLDLISATYVYRTDEIRSIIDAGVIVPVLPIEIHLGFSWSSVLPEKHISFGLITRW